ncbi:MAG TPA: hypothetical protein VJS39_01005, partial [Gemmatimonadaceae bacterium]|nr:hypothetical protein [Gemmatimonadaceae bacterium]
MTTSRAVGLVALTLVLACRGGGGSGSGDKAVQTSSVSVSQPVAINDTGKRSDPCPRTGLWAQCSI